MPPMVGIDYLLEGPDSDDDDQPASLPAPKPVILDEPIDDKKDVPQLSGIALLKAQYAKDEADRVRRKSSAADKPHKKVKLKIKKGYKVDIYSSSKKQWFEGTITEIKGDTLCVLYGNKMKWLKKHSKQIRFKMQQQQQQQPSPVIAAPQQHVQHVQQPVQQPQDIPPPAFAMPVAYSPDNIAAAAAPPAPAAVIPGPPPPQPSSHYSSQPAPPLGAIPPASLHNNVNGFNHNKKVEKDHYIYDVTFGSAHVGLILNPHKDGKNCIVTQCVSVYAQKMVDPGSMLCAINGTNVFNSSYDAIHAHLKQCLQSPPIKITFRAKTDGNNYQQINNVNQRGTLNIKVVACMQLKHAARYVSIQVGNAHLVTKETPKSDHHPEWNEVLSFKNFRCDHGKMAVVTVYDKSTILKDKKVGKVQYPLPLKFNKLQKDTLELKNSSDKLCGCIILNTMVVKK